MGIFDIERRFNEAETYNDLVGVVGLLIEHLIQYEIDMDDTLSNLDSDNIVEIDFGRTRFKNFNGGGNT